MAGYVEVARRDRGSGSGRGGVAIFATSSIADKVTCVHSSSKAERVWVVIHSSMGEVLLGTWYRTPGATDHDGSIQSLQNEHTELASSVAGTLLVGDLNAHHVRWLQHSSGTSVAGEQLRQITSEMGLPQLVKEPTRRKYLLHLALSDIQDASAAVLPAVADHRVVEVTFTLPMVEEVTVSREIWLFKQADWDRMNDIFAETDWSLLGHEHPDDAVARFNQEITAAMSACVPKKAIQQKQSTHPWLNDKVKVAVSKKVAAAGTAMEAQAARDCSKIIAKEREVWIAQTRAEMMALPRGSWAWWKKEKQLQQKVVKPSGIPALRQADKTWALESQEKADLLAATFRSKCHLPSPPAERSGYDEIIEVQVAWPDGAYNERVNLERADYFLKTLDEGSATGPDHIPACVLKRCHDTLAAPLLHLCLLILRWGHWPSQWTEHWIAAIHKKKEVFNPKNYRGVHMTPQVAKVMERLLGSLFIPSLSSELSIGPNQFAYCKKRGSRDALLYLVVSWLLSFMKKCRVALYCSDVSGAFDKVCARRLIKKLSARGMPTDLLAVVESWLRSRKCRVVVTGAESADVILTDQVFQGTVWGPTLWNNYYADAKTAIREKSFEEIVFADDLNAFREYSKGVQNDVILQDMKNCQVELHKWGAANQVQFDPGKESSHILSRQRPHGRPFKILGVEFDCKLIMTDTVCDLAKDARWKLKAVLRTKRYVTGIQLVDIYKSQILSFVEYRTPAIYHACFTALQTLDSVQETLLAAAGMNELEAMYVVNLAPLSVRRDIALLGVIHRTILGRGPCHFKRFIKRLGSLHAGQKHRFQLQEYGDGDASDYALPNSSPAAYIQNSMLGLIAIYNRLPAQVVEGCGCVPSFQRALQDIVKARALVHQCTDWKFTFSPRIPLHRHPVLSL